MPGASWLQRLRSSRGFPDEAAIDLEHFLGANSLDACHDSLVQKAISESSLSTIQPTEMSKPSLFTIKNDSSEATIDAKNESLADLMSSMLADLFNMEHESMTLKRTRTEKICRKQTKPKMCPISYSSALRPPCSQVLPISLSISEDPVKQAKGSLNDDHLLFDDVEETCQLVTASNVDSLSHLLVTIIDTSSPAWKSERLLFRKGNVWKIRRKKWILNNLSRKRRKMNRSKNAVGEKTDKQEYLMQHNKTSPLSAEKGA